MSATPIAYEQPLAMPIVDIHTHVYPPSYMRLLESRTTVPYVRSLPSGGPPRLFVLPSEDPPSATSTGRPIGPEYYDIGRKISFMDTHNIDISVISLANPWLDMIPASTAADVARDLNDELNSTCAGHPGRLFAFGALPMSAPVEQIVAEVHRLAGIKFMRGVVMGTGGLGQGLDDARLDGLYEALQETRQMVFLHPHYGLPREVYGPRGEEYGFVLPLALGFPLETTIAVSRMMLSGVWDRFPDLTVLLAHSGGTLPFLAGRLESCIAHDGKLLREEKVEGRRGVRDILEKNILLDAVVYSDVGLRAAVSAVGAGRVLFGTDNPFFPPLSNDGEKADEGQGEKWLSVTTNYKAIKGGFGPEEVEKVEGVLGGNAVKLLRLEV